MRLGSFREHFSLMLLLAGVSFFCFDEEPMLDLTDFNALHIWVLVCALAMMLFEPTLSARSGQLVYKDTVTLVAALTFWLGLENYTRLVLLVFSVHNLMPLEADLMDSAELMLVFSAWLTHELLPSTFFLGMLFMCASLLNMNLGAKKQAASAMLCFIICLSHLGTGAVLAWDFVMASFSSMVEWEQAEVFYLQPRTGWTYNSALRTADQFEWHRERNWPYSLRFEDLYFFFFQLLLVWDVMCSTVVWFYIFANCYMGRNLTVSYTQLSLGFLWLEHLGVALLFNTITMCASSFRTLFRTPGEFGGWWW